MNKTFVRAVFALLLVTYVLTHFLARAHAQSSLGIGTNDAIAPTGGMFAGLMQWINVHQQQFYRALTGALKGMREETGKLWVLVGLSFAYGVFHAAGPGHGKAVISSYMLANEVALRRGVMLSFVSALLQAVTALVVMGLAFVVLRGTSVSMTDAAWSLEIASYALVTAFGAWLLWTKLGSRLTKWRLAAPAYSLSAAAVTPQPTIASGLRFTANPDLVSHRRADGIGGRFECAEVGADASGEICTTCGRSHMADPALISGDSFDWRTAWSAVVAVGLRPCSGALIVLTFAFLNGLWLGGVLSVLAMALGTAITVSALAVLAVTAKNWAVALAGSGRAGNRIHAAIEIGGAAMIFLLGITLLTASLNA